MRRSPKAALSARDVLCAFGLAAAVATVPAALALANSPGPATTPSRPAAGGAAPPAATAVKGFDEAGVSTGTGDAFTAADWRTIKQDGFRLFLTDPVMWSSECSGGSCDSPARACTVDPAAVAQLQDAYHEGIDYAVYTRNPGCLTSAINGLPPALRAHLSFAVLDIEPGPSVPVTASLLRQVTALGQTPVMYSYSGGWQAVMHGSTAARSYPLQDGEVANWNARFPAAYPARYPALVTMPSPYGGWSGRADIEQQQCCTDIAGPAGTIGSPSDPVDLDAVSASWLASLPHQA